MGLITRVRSLITDSRLGLMSLGAASMIAIHLAMIGVAFVVGTQGVSAFNVSHHMASMTASPSMTMSSKTKDDSATVTLQQSSLQLNSLDAGLHRLAFSFDNAVKNTTTTCFFIDSTNGDYVSGSTMTSETDNQHIACSPDDAKTPAGDYKVYLQFMNDGGKQTVAFDVKLQP